MTMILRTISPFLLLLILSSLCLVSIQKEEEALRLLKFGPGDYAWHTPEQVKELSASCIGHSKGARHFFDVTDDDEDSLRDEGAILRDEMMGRGVINTNIPSSVNTDLDDDVKDAFSLMNAKDQMSIVLSLSAMTNRFFDSQGGVDGARWIKEHFEEIAKGKTGIKVDYFDHPWLQSSVIATIPGKGPNKDEIVIIGGHQDSINLNSDDAPGADDNASGISVLITAFKALIESGFQNDRTLQFMAYAAEEVGLRGSNAIAKEYQAKNKQVVGVVQFDMTMFTNNGDNTMVMVTDYVSSELTAFVSKLAKHYLDIETGVDHCGYACSDHASWTRYNFKSACPFEGKTLNKAIHTSNDKADILDANHGLQFAKLATAFLIQLGGKAESRTSLSSECLDKNDKCGKWSKEGYCKGEYEGFMSKNCSSSCGLCNDAQADVYSFCRSWKVHCANGSDLSPFMIQNCPATCNSFQNGME